MSFLPGNLAALNKVSPGLAAAIKSASLANFEPATGTDATTTYRRIVTLADGKKRVEWLGATSMPRASAGPIVRGLDANSKGANGLGLSIGTGFEWAAFTQRLSRSQMVYVYEPDLAVLRMALEICDLSALLATCRIVLLSGESPQAAQELAIFLDTHLGFDPPTVLHPLPSIAPSLRNQLLSAGESIVRHALAARQARVSPLPARITQALHRPSGNNARVETIAFLLTPHYPAERPIIHEANRLHARCVVIDRHDLASPALRLHILAEELEKPLPDGSASHSLRILSDLFRPQLATIPMEVPVETWVPPLVGPAFWDRVPPPEQFARHDRIVVHFAYHADRLDSRGISKELIELRPLAPTAHRGMPPSPALALRHRVALIADLPATDADSLGITLPTHQAVFAAAQALISDDYLAVHPGIAPDLLRRALARAGIDPQTHDAALQEPMLRIIRDVLIPALPLLILAKLLVDHALPLTLVGDWTGLERFISSAARSRHVRVIRFEKASTDCWNEAAVLAHLSPTGVFSPLLWEALAAEVTLAAPDHPSDRQAGSLPHLLKPDVHYARCVPQQFTSTLKSLLGDSARRRRLSAAASKLFA